MTKEALKLALEALEDLGMKHFENTGEVLYKETFTVIKEALAQPEQDGKCKYCTDGCPACDARKSPEQEQEPMAWMHTKLDGVVVPHRPADLDRHSDRWEALYKNTPPCPTCEALARTVMLDQTSHDTNPPQRTWVGLKDDDEIDWDGGDLKSFVKAIEAKLKEKNT